jgi:peptide chain release factor 3
MLGKPDDAKNNEFKEFKRIKQKFLAKDKYGQLVFLADPILQFR